MKSKIAAGGVSVGLLILTLLLPALWREPARFFPGSLTGYPNALLTGTLSLPEALPAVLSALILTLFFLGAGIFFFEKQEI